MQAGDFEPTHHLRFVPRWVPIGNDTARQTRILQQLWREVIPSMIANPSVPPKEEWRDVEVVDE